MRELFCVIAIGTLLHTAPLYDLPSGCLLQVSAAVDGGAGSLRSAIAAAARCDGYADIRVNVKDVYLDAPLPKLTNAWGVRLRGNSRIQASDVTGPLITVQAPVFNLEDITVGGEGDGMAVVAIADHVHAAGVRIENFEYALVVARTDAEVALHRSHFESNHYGLYAAQPFARIEVSDTTFAGIQHTALHVLGNADSAITLRRSRFLENQNDIVGNYGLLSMYDSALEGARQSSLVASTGDHHIFGSRIHALGPYALMLDGNGSIVLQESLVRSRGIGLYAPNAKAIAAVHSEIHGDRTNWVLPDQVGLASTESSFRNPPG